jgi:hypothetical protein
MTLNIQLGDRVRRRNDIGMDIPGAVVRLNVSEIMVYWPQDNFYEIVPVAELELYIEIPESIAA